MKDNMAYKVVENVTLGITGATGIPIAFTLLEHLLKLNCKVHLILTTAGIVTAKQETGISLSSNPNTATNILIERLQLKNGHNLVSYSNNDWYAPVASGTSVSDAMIICPCSMASLGKIASGVGDNLLCRAADVTLKERKNLILVPRETPLSVLHLANMQRLAELQVSILPPMPAFYTHPKSVQDIINFIVGRILDQIGLKHSLYKAWGTHESE